MCHMLLQVMLERLIRDGGRPRGLLEAETATGLQQNAAQSESPQPLQRNTAPPLKPRRRGPHRPLPPPSKILDDTSVEWLESAAERIKLCHSKLLNAPPLKGVEANYKRMQFRDFLDGDILLMNTNAMDRRLGMVTGPFTPGGQMGMMHTSMVHTRWYGGVPDRALVWEISGSKYAR